MRTLLSFVSVLALVWSSSSQAFTVWVVEKGQDPFANSQNTVQLSAGTSTLDLYYDVGGDSSYGYDLLLNIAGATGSITNVGGGDSGLGAPTATGWHQLGGDPFVATTGNSVLGFSFDFTAEAGASLSVTGSYTDANFTDSQIIPSTLAEVSQVPIPAAIWLFGTAIFGIWSASGNGRRSNA